MVGFLTTASAQTVTEELKPFFQQHCISCHGPEKQKGSLRIDQLSASLDDLDSVEHLQNILDEITVDSMPPEDEPRPSSQELAKVIPLLTEHIRKASEKHSSGGGKPVRRLTKIEYTNTVYDLLGVYINAESLPDDGAVGVFDTEAQALYTTDMYFENYMEVARGAVRRFIASRSAQPGEKSIRTQRPPKKGNKFALATKEIPPAGHLKVRFACWKETLSEDLLVPLQS